MGFDLDGKSGNHFRANMWAWRPLKSLIDATNVSARLSLDEEILDRMNYNDGAGFGAKDSRRLADALQKRHDEFKVEDIKELTINLGGWVDKDGHFVIQKDDEGETIWDPSVRPYGTRSAHSIQLDHLQEFIDFLRECGGFEAW